MAQVCSKCSHVNPADAAYCYWDGAVLEGHHRNGGSVAIGSRPFPSQFVFPSGQICRNFDQLAMSCHQNWKQAVDLLKKGFLASFLGGLGRADLALAAQEAARFPDQDRGLDQLLAKLPSHVLEAPKLKAEPTEVNLGVTRVGTDRKLELHLSNLGMRLLYGSVVSDSKWLTLGDGPGNAQKLFQFGNEAVVPVHVRGQHLRAGNKPLEGHLVVESNGGTATITIRADVPIKPYPDGVLAGALTPRQIAEKAKAHPKEAAPFFENGAVAQWFKDNGWTYPVQGPSASGLGAVQQFFEALGLATAPKLEINQRALTFRGNVGQSLQTTLEVRTPEKRPVYAHASADVSWLDVSKTTLSGRVATITVRIPSVPNCSGQTLSGVIRVTGNGNQRFRVPVTLVVEGGGYVQVLPAAQVYPAPNPFALDDVPVVAAVPVSGNEPLAVVAVTARPVTAAPAPIMPVPVIARPIRRNKSPLASVVPAALLLLILLGLVIHDSLIKGTPTSVEPDAPYLIRGDDGILIDTRPRIALYFEDGNLDEYKRPTQQLMGVGVVMLDPTNPTAPVAKRLTYSSRGVTNTTVVRIDNNDWRFGNNGRWEIMAEKTGRWGGKKSVWMFDSHVRVTQTAEIIPGEPVEVSPQVYHRLLDTCLVRYTLENVDRRPHQVGIRTMVDTLIGANDGVPFTIPGEKGLVGRNQFREFKTPQAVPDFIQALEVPDVQHPETVAQMNLKLGGKLEPPSAVSLTHWPGISPFWLVPPKEIGDDSCVVIYWDPRELAPGQSREVGYSYGVGSVSAKTADLGVTVGGAMVPGGELSVVAQVKRPQPGQKLTLTLPSGFSSIAGPLTQPVPPSVDGNASLVTWRIRAGSSGRYDLTVTSTTGIEQKRQVTIKTNTIF